MALESVMLSETLRRRDVYFVSHVSNKFVCHMRRKFFVPHAKKVNYTSRGFVSNPQTLTSGFAQADLCIMSWAQYIYHNRFLWRESFMPVLANLLLWRDGFEP